MRYWNPFTEEAIESIKRDKITDLVVLPLYPQFSVSTSGSSLRLLEKIFREDRALRDLKHYGQNTNRKPRHSKKTTYNVILTTLFVCAWFSSQ